MHVPSSVSMFVLLTAGLRADVKANLSRSQGRAVCTKITKQLIRRGQGLITNASLSLNKPQTSLLQDPKSQIKEVTEVKASSMSQTVNSRLTKNAHNSCCAGLIGSRALVRLMCMLNTTKSLSSVLQNRTFIQCHSIICSDIQESNRAPNFDDAEFANRLLSNLPFLNTHLVIFGGDLNCVFDPSLDRSNPPNLIQSAISKTFCDFMRQNGLVQFNSLLLTDKEFCNLISNSIDEFLSFNQNDSTSYSLLWETLKSYLRGQIISYSVHSGKRLNSRLIELTAAISDLDQKCALNPAPELFKQRIDLQAEFDLISTKGAERLLLLSRGSYYEHGDKESCLLARQLQRQATSCLIPSIKNTQNVIITDPTVCTKMKDFLQNPFNPVSDLSH